MLQKKRDGDGGRERVRELEKRNLASSFNDCNKTLHTLAKGSRKRSQLIDATAMMMMMASASAASVAAAAAAAVFGHDFIYGRKSYREFIQV